MEQTFTHEFKFDVGETVKDKVTGIKGIIVCSTIYLTGCNRYAIQQKGKADEKPKNWVYIDEPSLKRVKNTKKIVIEEASEVGLKKFGGFKPDKAQRNF